MVLLIRRHQEISSSLTLRHSSHCLSYPRHFIISHHHKKKGEYSTIRYFERDHIRITFMTVYCYNCSIFFKDFIYLFDRERSQVGREADRERGKQTPHWAGSLMCDSIPGPWDHDLSRRQRLNLLFYFIISYYFNPCLWLVYKLNFIIGMYA